MATMPFTLDHQGQPPCTYVNGKIWSEHKRHSQARPETEDEAVVHARDQRVLPIAHVNPLSSADVAGASAVTWRASQSGSSYLFRMARERAHGILFSACCLLVVGVSVYDAMLVVLHRSLIHAFEQNPLGQWLIDVQGGDVWFFVLVKLLGTALVCAVLIMLHECHARLAAAVTGGLAFFQIVLLWYLTCGDAVTTRILFTPWQ